MARKKRNKYAEHSKAHKKRWWQKRNRASTCARKARHRSMHAALKAIEAQPDQCLDWYHCGICDGYHLTKGRRRTYAEEE